MAKWVPWSVTCSSESPLSGEAATRPVAPKAHSSGLAQALHMGPRQAQASSLGILASVTSVPREGEGLGPAFETGFLPVGQMGF